MLGGLQLTTPLGLLLLPCAALLVFAYLKKRSGARQSVSSVIILKALPQHASIRRRFKPPLSFFLELLSLLFLGIAASQPLLRDSKLRVAVLFDTSLSMKAQSGGTSRFELAQTATKHWIAERNSSDRFTLFSSAPTLKAQTPQHVSRSSAQDGVRSLAPAVATDALPAALAELGASGDFDKILVVTDRPTSFAENTTSSDLKTEIDLLPLEVDGENLYISSTRIERSGDADVTVIVNSNLSGAAPREGLLKLFIIGQSAPLASAKIALRPGVATESKFPLGISDAIARGARVEISSDSAADALPEDNTMWIAADSKAQRAITLVSDTLTTQSSGLSSLPGFSISTLTPEQFLKESEAISTEPALFIFHHTAPRVAPRSSALFVLPPPQNSIFPVQSEVTSPTVTSWDSTHPLTLYARIPLMKLSAASVFETPPWAQAIVNVEQGALIVAGESEGYRFVGFGTELFPFEGQRTPTASILFLNTLRWLSGENELGASYSPGSALALEGDASWVISEPSGSITTIESTGEKPSSYIFSSSGLYRVASVKAGTTSAASQKQQLIAVNTTFPAESALYNGPALELPRLVEQRIEQVTNQASLTGALIWGALLVLLLDLLHRETGILGKLAPKRLAVKEEQ